MRAQRDARSLIALINIKHKIRPNLPAFWLGSTLSLSVL